MAQAFDGILGPMAWAASFAMGDRVALRRRAYPPDAKGAIHSIRTVATVTQYGRVVLDDGAPFACIADGVAQFDPPSPIPRLYDAPWMRNYSVNDIEARRATDADDADLRERDARRALPPLCATLALYGAIDGKTRHLTAAEVDEVVAAMTRARDIVEAAWQRGRSKGCVRRMR